MGGSEELKKGTAKQERDAMRVLAGEKYCETHDIWMKDGNNCAQCVLLDLKTTGVAKTMQLMTDYISGKPVNFTAQDTLLALGGAALALADANKRPLSRLRGELQRRVSKKKTSWRKHARVRKRRSR